MTIHDQKTVDNSKAKIRWEEPYVSEALNRVQAGGATPGVVHGFHLVPDTGASNAVVQVEHDPLFSNSVASVIDKGGNLSLTVQETASVSWDFDSIGVTGQRVWIFLYVDYQNGQATSVEYRAVDSAEFGSAWIDSAVQIGSVRVPSGGGTLANGDIEQGSGEFAGLGIHGPSRWWMASDNPDFRYGMSGYLTNGDVPAVSSTDFADVANVSMKLGRSGSGSSSNETGQLIQPLHHVEQDEVVLIRWRMKSANVSGDTEFKLLLQDANASTDEVTYDVQTLSLGSFQWFGMYLKVPSDLQYAYATLKVVFPNTSDTGEFYIDRFGVARRSQEDNISIHSPSWRAAEKVYIGEVNGSNASEFDPVWASLETTNTNFLPQFDAERFNEKIPVGDGAHLGFPGTVSSLLNTTWHEYRTRHSLDTVLKKRFIDGGTVAKTGPTEVTVDPVTVRSAEGDPGGNLAGNRFLEVTSSTTIDVSGLGGDGWVYLNPSPSLLAYEIDAVQTSGLDYSAAEEYVILGYIHWDSGSSEVERVTQVKDPADRLEENVPVTVGDTADCRFQDLRAAMLYVQEYYDVSDPEIVIKGSVTIDDVPSNGPVFIPDGTTIRGANKGATIFIDDDSSAGHALGNNEIAITFREDVTLENLTIRPGGGASILNLSKALANKQGELYCRHITIRDVDLKLDPSESVAFSRGIWFDDLTSALEDIRITNTRVYVDGSPIHIDTLGIPDERNIVLTGSSFQGGGDDSERSISAARVHGCHFSEWLSVAQNKYEFGSCEISACEFEDMTLQFSDCEVSGSSFRFEASPTASVYPLVTCFNGSLSGLDVYTIYSPDTAGDPVVQASGDSRISGTKVYITTAEATGIELTGADSVISGAHVELFNGSPGSSDFGIEVTADNCTISGCKIKGFPFEQSVKLTGSYNVVSGIRSVLIGGGIDPKGLAGSKTDTFGASGSGNEDGFLTKQRIVPGTVSFSFDNASGTISDDGSGNLTGDVTAIPEDNWIDYGNGAWEFDPDTTLDSNIDSSTTITVTYSVWFSGVDDQGTRNLVKDISHGLESSAPNVI